MPTRPKLAVRLYSHLTTLSRTIYSYIFTIWEVQKKNSKRVEPHFFRKIHLRKKKKKKNLFITTRLFQEKQSPGEQEHSQPILQCFIIAPLGHQHYLASTPFIIFYFSSSTAGGNLFYIGATGKLTLIGAEGAIEPLELYYTHHHLTMSSNLI